MGIDYNRLRETATKANRDLRENVESYPRGS